MVGLELSTAFEFHAAHRLPNHNGLCRRLHGHTYRGKVSVVCAVDANTSPSMLIDFFTLSAAVSHVVEALDHTTILNGESDSMAQVITACQDNHVLLLDADPTVECLSRIVADNVYQCLARVAPEVVIGSILVDMAESSTTNCRLSVSRVVITSSQQPTVRRSYWTATESGHNHVIVPGIWRADTAPARSAPT